MPQQVYGFSGWEFAALAGKLSESVGVPFRSRNNFEWREYFRFEADGLLMVLVKNQPPPDTLDPEDAAEPDYLNYGIILYLRSRDQAERLKGVVLSIPGAVFLKEAV